MKLTLWLFLALVITALLALLGTAPAAASVFLG